MPASWFFIVSFALTPSAWAAWQYEEHIDSMTDERRRMAMVSNANGHSFSVYRTQSQGAVWATFRLSESSLEQLDPEKLAMLRVDHHQAKDLAESLRDRAMIQTLSGVDPIEWKPMMVRFVISFGTEEGLNPFLAQLMEGRRLLIRYYLNTGGYQETEFSLNGSSEVLARALEISATVDQQQQQRLDGKAQVFELYAEELIRCTGASDFGQCSDRARACQEKADEDPEAFALCISR